MSLNSIISNRYKAYPEYKDSGVEWLGEIPSSWQLSKIKYTAPFQVGWTPSTSKDSNFVGDNLWANISDLGPKTIHDTTKRISDIAAKESSMDITPAGSLLYSFKLSVGTVSFAGCDMYTNEAIASFTSLSKLPLSYLYYTLPQFVIKNASTNIYGARILNQELIRNAIVLEPSYKEAEKIANFLDHETAKIDILIEKQQRLIELLIEKRQAVISHAVTKGLNPDAPMKDSGVEWLGDVPEHWEVLPLKYAVTFQRGHDLPAQHRVAGNVPLVTSSGVSSSHNVAIAKAPGLVTGRYGTIGKFNLLEEDYWPLNTTLYSINLRGNNPKYLWYMLHNLTPIFIANSLKSAVPGVDRNDLHVVKVAITKDLSEQKSLCEHLEYTHKKYDSLIERAKQAIQLMQERRTALISAAVTGKIDVRNWVKPE